MVDLGQWRYIAQRVDGATGGLGEFLDFNVPMQGVSLDEILSGHNSLTGTITPEYARLKGSDGRPLFEEWGTAIWAEAPDGEIRGGGVLTHSGFEGPNWQLECTDLTGVTIDLPYTEANWWVNVDPMDVFRYVWRYIQSQPNGNLGITIDPTTSPMRIGTDLVQRVEFDTEVDSSGELPEDQEPVPLPAAPNRYANNAAWVDAAVKHMKANGWTGSVVRDALERWLKKDELTEAGKWTPLTDKEAKIKKRAIEKVGPPPNPPNGFHRTTTTTVAGDGAADATPPPADPAAQTPTYQADPFVLAWYQDFDLSNTIDDLATATPFDWHLVHFWQDDEIRHHIRLGYPRIGRRRDELRFVVGENIHTLPSVERDGSEYANEVLVLGAGEGSSMIMGRAFRREDGRIRKVATISDPSIRTNEDAIARAQQELAKRFNLENVTSIMLTNHPHAPMGSVDLGDEILVEGDLGWIDLEAWCRVVGRQLNPDSGEAMGLTLIRTDRLG